MIASIDLDDATQDASTFNAADNVWEFAAFDVDVTIITNGACRDPIVGATVRLMYGGAIATDVTYENGDAALSFGVNEVAVSSNIREANMKLTVQAAGFEEYKNDKVAFLFTE